MASFVIAVIYLLLVPDLAVMLWWIHTANHGRHLLMPPFIHAGQAPRDTVRNTVQFEYTQYARSFATGYHVQVA
jgi:hypothetical protein